ncbi:MAG: Fis family transcriptional regulator [Gammaproteobacteria bacterium]
MNATTRKLGLAKPVLDTPGEKSAPLHECVRESIETYLQQLDGAQMTDLYAVVMREVEIPMLEAVQRYAQGNQSKAAQILGMNRGTLRKKLKLYGLD